MKVYNEIGIQVPQVYLPQKDTELTRWAVIACDQFTSQPDYWQQVEQVVGDSPSTLKLTLPEIYLEQPGEAERIRDIQSTMHHYLNNGVLEPREGLIYVERSVGRRTRKGVIVALDLEHYDFTPGATSLIRASEGVIVERLHSRIKIRQGAALELPHVLVLIDDPFDRVMGPLEKAKGRLEKVYDFDLMFDSGHLTGYAVSTELENGLAHALGALADPVDFSRKYGVSDSPVMLFALGDGNHSLASAKAIWDELKPSVGPDHPARYALAEIENIHDDALDFEPIHRVLFGLQRDILTAFSDYFGANFRYTPVASVDEMVSLVEDACCGEQAIGLALPSGYGVARISQAPASLAVGTLQAFLDDFMAAGGAERIDYVHGGEVVCRLGAQPGNVGFYLPGIDKSDLFRTIILDGVLPRKTFSMGEAHEKRFYVEARKII